MNSIQHKQPIADDVLRDIQVRNQYRQQQLRDQLGERYMHHPANHVQRVSVDVADSQVVRRWMAA